jgi:SAM-dependent methyltransferase
MHEAYSQYYADLWRRHWWWQVRQEVVLRELSHILPPVTDAQPKPQILDIGCAGGVAFDDFSRFGDVRGLEPDSQLIDSSPHWRSRIEQRPFTADYQPGCLFDVITMLDVLEHIEDDVEALEHLFGLLKPGGYSILTVPAMWWLTSIHDEINLHFRRYHRQPFKKMLLKTGFQILKIRYMFGWSVGLVYLRTWLRPKNIQEYHVDVPYAPVNALFAGLTRFENAIVNATGLSPLVGSSLLAVVRKAE